MAVTEALGGPAPLTGVLVTRPARSSGVTDCAARGFAVGLLSHGIGTARAFGVDPVAGVFEGLGIGFNAIVAPAMIPAFLPWLMG
jgi:putative effector of murein hydrolase